jgi:RhtB (resistance to homoserine/threonine) family protein
MPDIWIEFGKVALAHILAVASPGPDFAIVLRQSLSGGRRAALWTSAGVGTAILVHTGYSVLGIGLLMRSSPAVFAAAKIVGAAYLAWLGVQALRSKPREELSIKETKGDERDARRAFTQGFLTNALNVKATLFFVALFTTVIAPTTPRLVQAAYGVWMALVTAGWFALVSFVFTQERVTREFLQRGHWIDRLLGMVFLGFAAALLLEQFG